MKLYKKGAYVGAIWSLLQYSILIISAIAYSSMIDPVRSLLDSMPTPELSILSSLIPLLFLFGMCGIATSGIVIFSLKKIKKPDSIRRKLSKVLIITGIILFVLQLIQFPLMFNSVDETIKLNPYYTGLDNSSYTSVNGNMILGILFGMIPSIILIISGILAMKLNEIRNYSDA